MICRGLSRNYIATRPEVKVSSSGVERELIFDEDIKTIPGCAHADLLCGCSW